MPEQFNGEKILIVDDDPAIVDSVWNYLSLAGLKPTKASSGKECLEKLKVERPDVILLDVMMPEMEGFEVLDRIKQDKDLRHIPVLMVTVKSSDQDQLKGWQKGASHYITKPFEMEDLTAAVRLVLNERLRQINTKIYEI